MSEKPILFSTPMVKALLEGRKSMTRRIFKNVIKKYAGYRNQVAELLDDSREPLSEKEFYEVYSPYFKDDILWVREAWCKQFDGAGDEIEYRADWANKDTKIMNELNSYGFECPRWRPSIFIPRKAARIFLKVESVRVERLQGITTADAIKEGMPESMTGASDYSIRCFHSLWDTLDAKRGFGWDKNPWVWVIEFKRIEK
jgi:hypothetical protein